MTPNTIQTGILPQPYLHQRENGQSNLQSRRLHQEEDLRYSPSDCSIRYQAPDESGFPCRPRYGAPWIECDRSSSVRLGRIHECRSRGRWVIFYKQDPGLVHQADTFNLGSLAAAVQSSMGTVGAGGAFATLQSAAVSISFSLFVICTDRVTDGRLRGSYRCGRHERCRCCCRRCAHCRFSCEPE